VTEEFAKLQANKGGQQASQLFLLWRALTTKRNGATKVNVSVREFPSQKTQDIIDESNNKESRRRRLAEDEELQGPQVLGGGEPVDKLE